MDEPKFDWRAEIDGRRDAPSARRNAGAILDVLARVLPPSGVGREGLRPLVLEIAGGTGQHAVFMARNLPHLDWLTSDPAPELGPSLAAWARAAVPPAGPTNLLAPRVIDATDADWGLGPDETRRLVAIVNVNMIHIAPWAAAEGLVAGAGRHLSRGGVLYLYGPFKRGGIHTAPSNAAFDAMLRARDPASGLRDLDAVAALAETAGLALAEVVEMPANNLSAVFRKP